MAFFDDLYSGLTKTLADPVAGLGMGMLAGSLPGANPSVGLQAGMNNAFRLREQQMRQQAAVEEMLYRSEQLRMKTEESQRKSQMAQNVAQQYNLPLGVKPTAAQQNLVGSGLDPQSQDYQEKLLEYVNKPGVSITNQMPSQGERASGSYLAQMDQAKAEEKRLEASGNTEMSTKDAIVSDVAPGWMQPYLLSDGGQERLNMMLNWGRANLRDESGAVISDEEIQSMFPRYFPMEGDTDSTKQQKERARRSAEEAQRMRAGRAGTSGEPIVEPPPGQPQGQEGMGNLTPAEQQEVLQLLREAQQ